MDISKPFKCFVTIPRGRGRDDIWVRLQYKRLPTFCYDCSMVGHSDFECDMVNDDMDAGAVKQYVEWLHASPGIRGNIANSGGFSSVARNLNRDTILKINQRF
ncbi:hypothetical protein PTKIN_Ptkin11bG0131500 [Pterospermum kingtungense]